MNGRKNPLHVRAGGRPAPKERDPRQDTEPTRAKLTMRGLPGCAPDRNPDGPVWRCRLFRQANPKTG